MTIKEFQKQITDALTSQNIIFNILESENSLLVNCCDKSNFLLNILESKFTFIHNECEEEDIQKYILAHSKKEFAKDLLGTVREHTAFFIYFMLFTKSEEKGVIDNGLFYHIVDSIVCYEQEFEEFMIRLLCHYNINGNHPYLYKDNEKYKDTEQSQKEDEK